MFSLQKFKASLKFQSFSKYPKSVYLWAPVRQSKKKTKEKVKYFLPLRRKNQGMHSHTQIKLEIGQCKKFGAWYLGPIHDPPDS